MTTAGEAGSAEQRPGQAGALRGVARLVSRQRPTSSRRAEPATDAGAVAELASLLKRSADGDATAFAALYDQTAPRAYALAMRLLRDPAQVAGCVQDAYLHLWTHASRFNPDQGSPMSWVLAVVHQEAVRRVRSMPALAKSDPVGALATVGQRPGPLSALSTVLRRAVELAYFEGCTHTEIDDRCGLPVGTAITQMRSGLLAMKA